MTVDTYDDVALRLASLALQYIHQSEDIFPRWVTFSLGFLARTGKPSPELATITSAEVAMGHLQLLALVHQLHREGVQVADVEVSDRENVACRLASLALAFVGDDEETFARFREYAIRYEVTDGEDPTFATGLRTMFDRQTLVEGHHIFLQLLLRMKEGTA